MLAIMCIVCGSDRIARGSRTLFTPGPKGYTVMSIVPVMICESCGRAEGPDGRPTEEYDPR